MLRLREIIKNHKLVDLGPACAGLGPGRGFLRQWKSGSLRNHRLTDIGPSLTDDSVGKRALAYCGGTKVATRKIKLLVL